MKSEYEKLSDTAIFKFLQVIMKAVLENFRVNDQRDVTRLPKSSYIKEVRQSCNVLRNYGVKLDDLDRDYFWTTFMLNSDKIWEAKKLEGSLIRPKLKEYEIIIRFNGSVFYSEENTQNVQYYNEDTAKDIYNNDEFSPYEGAWGNYQNGDVIDSDWELDEVNELGEVKESRIKKTKIIRENFDNKKIDLNSLNLHQLVELKEHIDEKIRMKKSW